jgi:hypothetical protein
MGAGLLLLVAVIYAAVAVDYARQDRYGMCLAFVCYSLANLGFALDVKR